MWKTKTARVAVLVASARILKLVLLLANPVNLALPPLPLAPLNVPPYPMRASLAVKVRWLSTAVQREVHR